MDLNYPVDCDTSHSLIDVFLVQHIVRSWQVVVRLLLHIDSDVSKVLGNILAIILF